jgi:hypothetical protein
VPPRTPHRRRPGASPRVAIAAAIVAAASGCLSHEYRIEKAELARLARLPAGERGMRVRVVQLPGERRGEPVEGPWAPPPPPEPPPERGHGGAGAHHTQIAVHFEGRADVPIATFGRARRSGGGGGGRGFLTAPPAGARTAPPARVPAAAAAPPSGSPTTAGLARSAGQALSSGGGKPEELAVALVVVAVVVVAAAAVAGLTLAAIEGARYDGVVALSAGQPLHLRSPAGASRTIALGDLTVEDAARAEDALVMDDEGWGLVRLGRAPLDRRGPTFKLDVGAASMPSLDETAPPVQGPVARVQVGLFPLQRLGVVAGLSFSGGRDGAGRLLARHALTLEAQAFPLRLHRVHLGLFAGGGPTLIAQEGVGSDSGAEVAGGALVEIDVTTRLALSARAGVRFMPGRDRHPGLTLSAGLSIY